MAVVCVIVMKTAASMAMLPVQTLYKIAWYNVCAINVCFPYLISVDISMKDHNFKRQSLVLNTTVFSS